MHRGDLTDAQGARLQPLRPPQRRGKGTTGGRPSRDHRPIINVILWIVRTGAPWDDVPARYGKRWMPAHLGGSAPMSACRAPRHRTLAGVSR